ncbi:TPA: hypothetical protein L3747_005773 [Pseudomonas aeruginosa]|nr:hypothetical protein [Pseudomonas aeruginosa]
MNAPGHVKELPGQKTWVDYGLADLRSLPTELRSQAPAEIPAADSVDAAVELVANAFNLANPDIDRTAMTTPVGLLTVVRDKLVHIVEKRPDARERYTNHAISTLNDPYEVWKVEYDNGNHRLAFIGAFEGKRQMLVIVDTIDGQVLWNFMHTDAKSLNKHRHGLPIYQRSPPENQA